MKGRTPLAQEPHGTPYVEGSQLVLVTRVVAHVWPPSALAMKETSNSVFPLKLRSLVIRSSRPLDGSTLSSTLMRSPDAGATIAGLLHFVMSLTFAYVSRICAFPFTISVYAT